VTTDAAAPGSVKPPDSCEVPRRPVDAPPPGTVLSSHYDACVGCGATHPTGLRMTVEAGEGLTVRGHFTVTDDHQGAPGLTHGGLLALALDEVLGGLGWLLQTPMVTGRLQTEFVRPVPVGTTLELDAVVDGVAGRRIFCHAVARDAESQALVARAYAVFVAVSLDHFREHGDSAAVQRAIQRTRERRDWAVSP
jgi:acyl-coenzyme A thioesterase PaaI-like protein